MVEKKDEISIKIPEVMKQNNSIDCGLYAIAFVTSYCFRQKLCFELIFDSNKLRSHLLECFENNRISEFPLTSKTISTRKKKERQNNLTSELLSMQFTRVLRRYGSMR